MLDEGESVLRGAGCDQLAGLVDSVLRDQRHLSGGESSLASSFSARGGVAAAAHRRLVVSYLLHFCYAFLADVGAGGGVW